MGSLARLWRELASEPSVPLGSDDVTELLPGVDRTTEPQDLRALGNWVLARATSSAVSERERELMRCLTDFVLDARRPDGPLLGLMCALSVVPWLANRDTLQMEVVTSLDRADQFDREGVARVAPRLVSDRLCAVAALLSTADTDGPPHRAHLVQLVLNSCGAHTTEWPPLEDGWRIGRLMQWYGRRALLGGSGGGGVPEATAAVERACAHALERDGHHYGVVMCAIAGFLQGVAAKGTHTYTRWSTTLAPLEQRVLTTAAAAAASAVDAGAGAWIDADRMALSCCEWVVAAGATHAAALLPCLLHSLLDRRLSLVPLTAEASAGATAEEVSERLRSHSFSAVSAARLPLQTAICVIVKAADSHSDAAGSTRQRLAGFAQHLRSSYSHLLFNRPPDWMARVDSSLLGLVLERSFSAVVALAAETFPPATASEELAQLCETLADVEFAAAATTRANVIGSPRMRLLERVLTAITTSPAAATSLASRLPIPALPIAAAAPRDPLSDIKLGLMLGLLGSSVSALPTNLVTDRVVPVALDGIGSAHEVLLRASGTVLRAALDALPPPSAAATAASYVHTALAVFPATATGSTVAHAVAATMDALPAGATAKLDALRAVARRTATLFSFAADAADEEERIAHGAEAEALLNALLTAVTTVDFALLAEALAEVGRTVREAPTPATRRAVVRLQTVVSACDDAARKVFLVEWFLALRAQLLRHAGAPPLLARL